MLLAFKRVVKLLWGWYFLVCSCGNCTIQEVAPDRAVLSILLHQKSKNKPTASKTVSLRRFECITISLAMIFYGDA